MLMTLSTRVIPFYSNALAMFSFAFIFDSWTILVGHYFLIMDKLSVYPTSISLSSESIISSSQKKMLSPPRLIDKPSPFLTKCPGNNSPTILDVMVDV